MSNLFYSYSDYLKKRYHEKVYKLPISLPVTCPNRERGKKGCAFCAGEGTGFEAKNTKDSITEQLFEVRKLIESKYNAHKFIGYFQNYTNTYLPLEDFKSYMSEVAAAKDIVEIAISTRPDCIREDYLEVLQNISEQFSVGITVELGLQTANYHTLAMMERGHGLAEFIDAVLRIQRFGFDICVHVILNLPGDTLTDSIETAKILSAFRIPIVKIHSLYIAKNSLLCDWYKNGKIAVCSKEEYMNRLVHFIEYLSPEIAIERLFSRIPEESSIFCNWGVSWWRLKDEFEKTMTERESFQGKKFHYMNGSALEALSLRGTRHIGRK